MINLNCLVRLALGFVGCAGVGTGYSQVPDRDKRLPDVPIPRLVDVVQNMDLPKSEVVGWMNALEARLESLKYDVRVKADVSAVATMNNGTTNLVGWSLALRRARDPSKEAERVVTVRQNPMDNLAIAIGRGVAEDKRHHYDVLKLGSKVYSNSVTAFDYHVSELSSEVDAKSLYPILKYLYVFDPVRACTSSATMVRDGHALDPSEHCCLLSTVTAVLRDGDYVHVLLQLNVLRSNRKAQMLYTFKDQVPVQVVSWIR